MMLAVLSNDSRCAACNRRSFLQAKIHQVSTTLLLSPPDLTAAMVVLSYRKCWVIVGINTLPNPGTRELEKALYKCEAKLEARSMAMTASPSSQACTSGTATQILSVFDAPVWSGVVLGLLCNSNWIDTSRLRERHRLIIDALLLCPDLNDSP